MKNNKNNYENLTKKAEELVRERIKGTRKGLPDEPNYQHSFRVRDLVQDCPLDERSGDLFIAALLHDIVEDGGMTFEQLKVAGFSKRTVGLIDLCSHDPNVEHKTERWVRMIARLVEANDADAWRIKLADLTDNLSQARGLSPDNRKFMVEVKAPLLLRLIANHDSLNQQGHRLREEMDKQRGKNNLTD